MKSLITLGVVAAISAGVFALGSFRRGADEKPLLHIAEELPLTVKVARPEQRGIIRIVQAPGDVEAVLEVEVSSEIVAKIEEMPVEEGDVVEQGTLLCRLNDDDLRAAVESGEARVAKLEAGVLQAEAELTKALRDCQRQARLSEADATTDKERFDYLTVRKKAEAVTLMRKAELAEAQAALKRVNENLKRTVIESPIAGVISKLYAKQGEVVVTGTMNNPGTVIMSVSDLSKMQVRARVDEVDIPLVKPGQVASIFLQSEQQVPVPARVARVASKGTRMVGRDVVFFEVLLEVLSDDPRIKPAMTANVEIQVASRENAVAVPVEAIVHRMRKDLDEKIVEQFDAGQEKVGLSERARQAQYIKVVYIVEDEVARVRLVEPGIADTRCVDLGTSLTMDDVVIVGPYRSLDQLKDGKKILMSDEDKEKLAQKPAGDGDAEEAVADGGADASSASSDDAQTVAAGASP